MMSEASARFLNELQTILLCNDASRMVAKQRQVTSAASGKLSKGSSFAAPKSAISRSTRIAGSWKYLMDVSGVTGSIQNQHPL